MENKIYISIQELSRRWGITRRTAEKYIADGTVPSVRIGPRMVRVPFEAVISYERRNSSEGEAGDV